jgi:CheY-like chemotaxis protein
LHREKRLLAKARIKNPVVTFDDAPKVVAFLKAAASAPEAGLMPCVVFTDLKMPGMDGFELLRWIRGEKTLARLTVVTLSSSSHDKDMKRAKVLGVDEYLIKFPTPEKLARIVADAAKRTRKERP